MSLNPMDANTPKLALRQHHVVVALDDEPSILTALRRVFRNEQVELWTTTHPLQVLDWVGRIDISMVISDLRMPEMDGTSVLEEVRKISPATQRVMLTGYPSDILEQRAGALGIRSVMTKPWSDLELRQTVRLLLRERELKQGGGSASAGA